MSFSDYLLSTLGLYGPPALFIVLLVGAVGVPTPGSLLLLVAGSFVEQGEMGLWPVLALALAGVVVGDNLGYLIGRPDKSLRAMLSQKEKATKPAA